MKPAIKAVMMMMMMMMIGIAWVHAAGEPVMRMIRTARIHEAVVTMTVIISAMVTVAKTVTKMAAEMTEPTVAHA